MGDQDLCDDKGFTHSTVDNKFDSDVQNLDLNHPNLITAEKSKVEEFLNSPFQAPLKKRKEDRMNSSRKFKESLQARRILEENTETEELDYHPAIEQNPTEICSHSDKKNPRKDVTYNDTPTEKRYSIRENCRYSESEEDDFKEEKMHLTKPESKSSQNSQLCNNQLETKEISEYELRAKMESTDQSDTRKAIVSSTREDQEETKAPNEDLSTKPIIQGQKYQVDLGSVITIEQKLWCILESFSSKGGDTTNVFEHCEEWWDLVNSTTLSIIHSIFSDDELRRALRRSSILEFLSITMINFLSSESKANSELHGNLKVLTFYVHQNYLQLIT